MNWGICCLMVTGRGMSERLRNTLFNAAQKLVQENETRLKIGDQESFEGMVTTTFRTATLGSFTGVWFSAEVDSSLGTTKVEYLVHPCDLPAEAGLWAACL